MLLTRLRKDTEGVVAAELAIALFVILFVFGGIFDFMFAFFQWNMAIKAIERGARIAAVSNPVALGLTKLNTVTTLPGDPLPAGFNFRIRCDGAGCACLSGTCGGIGFDGNALNTIVYGRGNGAACAAPTNVYRIGMCNLFNRVNAAGDPLTPANVIVEYSYAAGEGIGFQGKPCGPVPTIAVGLQNVQFGFFFMRAFTTLTTINFTPARTTITGEDLSFNFPQTNCDN